MAPFDVRVWKLCVSINQFQKGCEPVLPFLPRFFWAAFAVFSAQTKNVPYSVMMPPRTDVVVGVDLVHVSSWPRNKSDSAHAPLPYPKLSHNCAAINVLGTFLDRVSRVDLSVKLNTYLT